MPERNIQLLREMAEEVAELTVRRMQESALEPLRKQLQDTTVEMTKLSQTVYGKNGGDGLVRDLAAFKRYVRDELDKGSQKFSSGEMFRERLMGIYIGAAGFCGFAGSALALWLAWSRHH